MESESSRRASWLELFFDLVLVAAIGALASRLHDEHSATGLVRFGLLFVPVWWSWWGFTWYSAAFNTDDLVNRIAFLAAMLGVGALAAGVPGAAEGRSTVFVIAYAGLFLLLAGLYARAWRLHPPMRSLSARYAMAYAVGAAIWLVSLLFDGDVRPFIWVVGMIVLMGGPVLAAASTNVLSYEPDHIAERYGLFTLIVLGESVVAVVAGLDTGARTSAVLVAVLGLVIAGAIWWGYFDRFRGMPSGTVRAGFVWAQGHLLVFAGIAAAAVGVEFAIEAAATGEELKPIDRLSLALGLAAYLAAMGTIRAATRRPDAIVALRLATAALLILLALIPHLTPLTYVTLITVVFLAECITDLRAAPPTRPAPLPLPHQLARHRNHPT